MQWNTVRLALLVLLVGGQLATILLARAGYGLWPVALPWLVSLLAGVLVCLPLQKPVLRSLPALRGWEVLVVVALTLLAALLRLPNLEHLPSGIHGDEGEFATWAVAVVEGRGPSPFGVAFLGDPALYVHMVAPFIAALGHTMEAVRLPSALFGLATVPILYGLTRELAGPRPAMLAALFLATSTVHIHFSRLGLNVIEMPFFACLSLWLLARGLKQQRDHWYVLAGIFGGIGFYYHFGARLIAPILLLVLIGHLIADRVAWRDWLRGIVLTGIGGLLSLSPLLAYLSSHPNLLTDHVEQRGIWNHWEDLAELHGTVPSDKVGILWGQVARTIEAFIWRPDPGYGAFFFTFFDAPLLNAFLAPLAMLGLAALCLRLRDPGARLVLLWFVVPAIFASVLTDTAGQAHRLIHPLLPAIIAAALLISWLSSLARTWLPRTLAVVAAMLFVLLPLGANLWEVQRYFEPETTARFIAFETAQARCMAALPPGTVAVVASGERNLADLGPSRYLGYDIDRRHLTEPLTAPVDTDGKPLVLLVYEWERSVIPQIQRIYPEAESVELERPAGQRVMTAFAVSGGGQSADALLAACADGGSSAD